MNDIFTLDNSTLLRYQGDLESVCVPEGVTCIAARAFENATLTALSLPASLREIQEGAFIGCTALEKVEYAGALTDWCALRFADYTSNPLFFAHDLYLSGVKAETLLIEAEKINAYAFCGCSASSVTFGEKVCSIGTAAFNDCVSLRTVSLPANLSFVGELAFRGCMGLADIHIQKGLKQVESWAFFKCEALTAVYFEGTLLDWLSISFRDVWANPLSLAHALYLNGEKVESLEIPKGVLRIPDAAFAGIDVSTLTLNDVIEVGDVAFYGCLNLTTVIGSPEKVGEGAFAKGE